MLDALGEASAEVAIGQGGQDGAVGDNRSGLMKCPDHVLLEVAGRGFEIDTRLAAYGGVDHREQRGRALKHGYAPAIDGGGEPGEVADDPATKRDNRVGTFNPMPGHL